MLPRELVEELISGFRAARFHILKALANALDRFLIVLTFPFEIVGEDVVKRIGGALAASSCEFLELRQSFRSDGYRCHGSNSIP